MISLKKSESVWEKKSKRKCIEVYTWKESLYYSQLTADFHWDCFIIPPGTYL